jgi:glucose-1-phosphate cytidylyltransferase
MKVVLFCGGYGMRMRNGSDDQIPKPMQMVGPRPLIWHVMRYYAHFGHKDFILCLGYGAAHIKNYFLTYQEAISNDFIIRDGQVELLQSDISDTASRWTAAARSPVSLPLRNCRSGRTVASSC